jgi:hypothetical protein
MTVRRSNQPDGSPSEQTQDSVGSNPITRSPAMPRPPDVFILKPAERHREIAAILAAGVVRLQSKSGSSAPNSENLSESSPTGLAIRPNSATHVTVREALDANTESQT